MKKQNIFYRREIALDEFILTLKYLMPAQEIEHVSGLCGSRVLTERPSEEAISDLFRRAVKHKVFVAEGKDVRISTDIYRYANTWIHAEKVLTFHKPSYHGKKLITFSGVCGAFLATIQDDTKNKIVLMMDDDPELLYAEVKELLWEKDVNKQYRPKQAKKELAGKGIDACFTLDHVFQLTALPLENQTGQPCGQAKTFHVGKEEFELLNGELAPGCTIEKYFNDKLDEMLLAMIREYCTTQFQAPPGYKPPAEDKEPYTRYSYVKLTSSEKFPKKLSQMLVMQTKTMAKQALNWKRLLLSVGGKLLIAALVVFWNLYGLCYLNDTFRIDENSFLGNATAYLFGGTLGRGQIKGLQNLDIGKSMLLSASFYALVGLAFQCICRDLFHGKLLSFLKGLFTFPKSLRTYGETTQRSFGFYFWSTMFLVIPVGFFLFNPFTVALLGLMLVFSGVKQDGSMISVPLMVYSCAGHYRKVEEGKQKEPLFAQIQLRVFSFGTGLLLYSVINALCWFLFGYALWARIVASVLLLILAFIQLGIVKIERPQKAASLLVMLAIGAAVILAMQSGVSVFADDGGWSESGRTLAGLFQNSGFAEVLGFSAVLGLAAFVGACTFGLALVPALAIGGAAAGGAFAWSATTETGRATASIFILGDYSPYADNETAGYIAGGLNLAVGFVPGISEVWGMTTGIRDAHYDFSNGNYLSGILDVACFGLSAKGLKGGLKTAGQAVATAGAKTWVGQNVSKQFVNGVNDAADDILRGAGGSADDATRAVQSAAPKTFSQQVADASRQLGYDTATEIMTEQTARVWSNPVVNKVASYQAKRQITKNLTKPMSDALSDAAGKYVKDAAKSNAEQLVASKLTKAADGKMHELADLISSGGQTPAGGSPMPSGGYVPPSGGQVPPSGVGYIPPSGGQVPPNGGGYIPPNGGTIPPNGGPIPPGSGTIPSTGGSIPADARTGIGAGAQTGIEADAQSGIEAGVQAGVESSTQTGIGAGARAGAEAGAQAVPALEPELLGAADVQEIMQEMTDDELRELVDYLASGEVGIDEQLKGMLEKLTEYMQKETILLDREHILSLLQN